MKKGIIFIFIIVILLTSGCTKNENEVSNQKLVHEHCTRLATAKEGINVNLSYEIYYKGEVLTKLEATEEVETADVEVQNQYENAYKSIHSNYEGLKYYNTSVTKKDNKITSKIIIDYEKIDVDKLIEIEGEEDNIFENKIPKVDKWKSLAKSIGTTCEKVTE